MTDTVNDIKKLQRSTSDRMVAGVCGGWADYLGVDPAVIRIGMVAATVLGAGAPALIYAACWVLTPESAEAGTTPTTAAE